MPLGPVNSGIGRHAPSFSMSGRLEINIRDDSPGPGAYSPRTPTKTSPRYTMSSKTNRAKSKLSSPGPGAYTIVSSVGKGPKKTFSGRQKSYYRNNTPGPVTYNYSSFIGTKKEGSPRYSMKSRSCTTPKSERNQNPGPGTYDSHGFIGKGKKFSMSPRSVSKYPKQRSPGPGAYSRTAEIPGPKYSMPGRRPYTASAAQPGPGAYDAPVLFGKTATMVTMKGKHRGNLGPDSPGPGAYAPVPSIGRAPAFSFRPKSKSKARELSPGPGAYNKVSDIGKGPKKSMSPRRIAPLASSEISPGPGEYKTSRHGDIGTGPSYSMGGKGLIDIQARTPGPGDYALASTLSTRSSSLRGRISPKNTSITPGPVYSPKMNLTKSPSYSMGRKYTQKVPESVPGPGAYTVGHM